MLSEAEKKWLYSRENVEMVTGTYLCQFCQYMDDELEECIFRRCPKFVPNYRDAAEFEARVAAKLVSNNFPCRNCPDFRIATKCPLTTRGTATDYGPFPCLLRQARLIVEEEMEE